MKNRIKQFITRHEEFIIYIIVGCMTTLVAMTARFGINFLFFSGTKYPSFSQNTILSAVDWVAGVSFAYPMNRRFVFKSNNTKILAEASEFVLSRALTLGLDWAVTQLLGTVIGLDIYITWIIKTVIVFISNYVLSKLFVFKKK